VIDVQGKDFAHPDGPSSTLGTHVRGANFEECTPKHVWLCPWLLWIAMDQYLECAMANLTFTPINCLTKKVGGIQSVSLDSLTQMKMRSSGRLNPENAHHLSDGQRLGNCFGKIRI
jgi:hypothetical protein